jgi:diguanylate cyclase (GGDEF)-like protein
MTDHNGAVTVAETLLDQIRELNLPHRYSLVAERVTISLGIATMLPSREDSPTILIDRADKALYASKIAGRNRFTTWISDIA